MTDTRTRRRRASTCTSPPTTSAPRCRSDADRGLRSTPEGHPAEVVLRHPRVAALRRHHPPARVLPDAVRAGDPRGARGRDRRGHRRRHARRARFGNLRQDAHPARRAARRGHDHALRSVRRERADVARRGRGGEPRLPDRRACTRSSATSSTTSASIPGGGRRLVAFLGGTIGNLEPPGRAEFLREIADGPRPRRLPAARSRPRQGHRPPRSRLRRQRRASPPSSTRTCSR